MKYHHEHESRMGCESFSSTKPGHAGEDDAGSRGVKDPDEVEAKLQEAEKFLIGASDTDKAPIAKDIQECIRRSVDDPIDWDVIAVVEGPGTINHRVVTEVIDQRTRDVLGKIETYPPVDCVRIRVIALRAGPVAIGRS